MPQLIISSKSISNKNNFWVVRAGKGACYYNHFLKNNLVAIGHTREIDFENIQGELSSDDKNLILNKYKNSLLEAKKSKPVISRQASQVNKFISEIKKNDIIITITEKKIIVGKAVSSCYYDKTDLKSNSDDKKILCDYPLRINVEWGTAQSREYIPYIIDKSFRNTGTIFNLSHPDQKKILNHWLSPIHFVDNEVRCSVNIKSQKNLSNKQLSNLSNAYNQLELLANFIANADDIKNITKESFKSYLDKKSSTYEYSLTAQHSFMSPGFQFIQLNYIKKKTAICFALAFATCFNSNLVFAQDTVNNEELNNKIIELVQIIKTPEVDDSIKSLKAEIQKQITKTPIFEEPSPSTDSML